MQEKAEKALSKVWRGKDQRMRARALQLLARIEGEQPKYLKKAIEDKNPDIQIEGLRIARALKLDVTSFVAKLVDHPSPQVRRECALALQHQSSPEAAKLWRRLALQYDGKDRWYLEALGIGADGQWDAFLSAWLNKIGDAWNTPAGRDILWRSRASKTPEYLTKIIADPNTPQNKRSRYFRALDFFPTEQREKPLIDLLGATSH
jgi:hypothetical protein